MLSIAIRVHALGSPVGPPPHLGTQIFPSALWGLKHQQVPKFPGYLWFHALLPLEPGDLFKMCFLNGLVQLCSQPPCFLKASLTSAWVEDIAMRIQILHVRSLMSLKNLFSGSIFQVHSSFLKRSWSLLPDAGSCLKAFALPCWCCLLGHYRCWPSWSKWEVDPFQKGGICHKISLSS